MALRASHGVEPSTTSAGPQSPKRQLRYGQDEDEIEEELEPRGAALLFCAFGGAQHGRRALVDRGAAERHRSVFDGVRELCLHITRRLAEEGHLAPGKDPEREAARLQALTDGLAVEGLVGRLDNDEMLGVLDDHLDEIIRGA